MKTSSKILSLLTLPLIVSACASTSVRRGAIVMKLGEQAHVGMGSKDVSVGDHIELYRNECTPSLGAAVRATERTCKKVPGGHGEVTQVLNEDYSIVNFPAGTKFSEGDTIEKHAH
jgi:hypothetical protein